MSPLTPPLHRLPCLPAYAACRGRMKHSCSQSANIPQAPNQGWDLCQIRAGTCARDRADNDRSGTGPAPRSSELSEGVGPTVSDRGGVSTVHWGHRGGRGLSFQGNKLHLRAQLTGGSPASFWGEKMFSLDSYMY